MRSFRPTGRQGVLRGLSGVGESSGAVFVRREMGKLILGAIFSKLTQYDFPGWAVLEWECCIKSSEQGAALKGRRSFSGTSSRRRAAVLMILRVSGAGSTGTNRRMLGIGLVSIQQLGEGYDGECKKRVM